MTSSLFYVIIKWEFIIYIYIFIYLYLYLYLYFPFHYNINFPACQDCIQYTFPARVRMLEIFTPTKFQLAEGPYIPYEVRNIAAYRGPNYRRNAACEAPVGIEIPA